MSIQQASYDSSICERITKKDSKRNKSSLRRSCETDETGVRNGTKTKRIKMSASETRAENEKRQSEIRDYVFSVSLPGVEITHCNFGKTQVEVWYVTKATDSDRFEEEMRKQIGSRVDPYKLKLVKKAGHPTFKYTSPGQSTRLMRRDGSIGAYVTLTGGNRGESKIHALVCGHGKEPGDVIYSNLNPEQRIGEVRVAKEGDMERRIDLAGPEIVSEKSYDVGLVLMDQQRVDQHEASVTMTGERIKLARATAALSPEDMIENHQVMLFKNNSIKGRVRYLNYSSKTQQKFGMIGITKPLGEKMRAVHAMNESGTLVVALPPYPENGEKRVKAVGMLVGIEEFESPHEIISLAVPIGRNLKELMKDHYCANKRIEFA